MRASISATSFFAAEPPIPKKGYDEIIESLPQRFPPIPPTWHDEMAEQPWHVERVLFSRDEHLLVTKKCAGARASDT